MRPPPKKQRLQRLLMMLRLQSVLALASVRVGLLVVVLFFGNQLMAQDQFRFISDSDGYKYQGSKSVTQDDEGLIWIAGEAGLVRYDGTSFQSYQATDSMGAHFFPSLGLLEVHWVEAIDQLVIRHPNYLYFFDPKTEHTTSYSLSDILGDTRYKSAFVGMAFSSDGLWIHLQRKGSNQRYRWTDEGWILVEVADVVAKTACAGIGYWTDSLRYFCPSGTELICVADYSNDSGLIDANLVYTQQSSGYGRVSEDYRVFDRYLQDSTFRATIAEHSGAGSYGNNIVFDSRGFTWVKDGGKVIKYRNGKPISSFKFGDLTSIDPEAKYFFDTSNNLWIPASNGILVLPDEQELFERYLYNPSVKWGRSIRSINSCGGNLYVMDESRRTMLRSPIEQPQEMTYSHEQVDFFFDYHCTNDHGLYQRSYTTYMTSTEAVTDTIDIGFRSHLRGPLRKMPDSTILLCPSLYRASKSAVSSDGRTTQLYSAAALPSDSVVISALILDDSTYWAGTNYGVIAKLRLREGTGQISILQYEQIAHVAINDIVQRGSEVWCATQGQGIVRYDVDSGDVTTLGVENGLANDYVCRMIADDEEQLWVSTYNGLSMIDADVITNYYSEDGLTSSEFNRGSGYKDKQGRIYFGTINGFIRFDPRKVARVARDPKPLLLSSYSWYDGADDDNGYKRITSRQTDVLTFGPALRWVEFSFSLLDYIRPDKAIYEVHLEGLDDTWNTLDASSSIRFNSLRPGHYTLQVRGTDAYGVPASNEVSLPIIIRPYWYHTWWARLSYLLLALLLGYAIAQAYLRRQILAADIKQERLLQDYKSQIYTNITHEIKTPLTVIKGMATNISKDPRKWAQSGSQSILTSVSALSGLIQQILDLRKLEQGEIKLEQSQINVVAYLEYLIASLSSLAQLQQQRIALYSPTDTLWMDVDIDKFKQVVVNLLSNAIKYNKGPAKIKVLLDMSDDLLTIRIEDSGLGIHQEDIPRIFDQFYIGRAEGRRSIEGTGIGLALVQELVQLMGGSISVDSELGRGSTFTTVLPVTTIAEKASLPKHEPVLTTAHPVVALDTGLNDDSHHILVVEDNYDVAAYIETCLSGYSVSIARDGIQGLDLCRELLPDLVISDLMMPRLDGAGMVTEIRRDALIDHIPVVMLTAKTDLDDRLKGIGAGVDSYLGKPFEEVELRAMVAALIRQRRQLVAKYSSTATISEGVSGSSESAMDHPFFLEIVSIIEQHYQDSNFGVDDLANGAHLSTRQLSRKLKSIVDITPVQLIKHTRLEHAHRLLCTTDLAVKEIAYEVGFSNVAHFSTSFKDRFGKSPSNIGES